MQEANSRLLRERGEVQESARGAGISSFQTAPQTPDAGAGVHVAAFRSLSLFSLKSERCFPVRVE